MLLGVRCVLSIEDSNLPTFLENSALNKLPLHYLEIIAHGALLLFLHVS